MTLPLPLPPPPPPPHPEEIECFRMPMPDGRFSCDKRYEYTYYEGVYICWEVAT